MKKITFTEEQKQKVFNFIEEQSNNDMGTYYRTLVQYTEIPLNVLKKITNELKQEGKITVSSLIDPDGDRGGYYGKGFMT